MVKKIGFFVSIILVTVFFTGVCFAKTKLIFNNFFPSSHIASKLSEEWCKEIEKRTDGEVEIQYFSGAHLLKANHVFDGITKGIADIGLSNLAYTPGLFPEMALCDLPFGMPSAWVATYVANKFYNKYRPKEFDKTKVLFFFACGPNLISTTNTPIKTLEDLKGQNLRATGRIADTAKALGAASTQMAIGETYKALQYNVISGAMLPFSTLKDFRFGEIVKYCTTNWQVGNVYTFYVVMNKYKWDQLPEKTKKVFEDVNQIYIDKMGIGWNQADLEGIEYFKSKKGRLIQLSATEEERWNKAVEPVIKKYCQEMTRNGLSMKELKERVKFIRTSIKEMNEIQLSRKIPLPYGD
ncbi:TRAP transporter substrate-binding protein [Desulfobacula phenolica]|uniref:TRAP-type C4-dicarboxylate transport system, substrate-binding protein n=1 Tax=Desulfobacula phenolica TaxID=90732 RepID=A0A1H2IUR5_9BACT|nr:TRAP transporter substrate-binding protein [Desulfobacula phenolica]SDU47880.1 TRAP-type C4-dicarboxylate transport system, substrate-binding protein [Desulfobacula phenolica]